MSRRNPTKAEAKKMEILELAADLAQAEHNLLALAFKEAHGTPEVQEKDLTEEEHEKYVKSLFNAQRKEGELQLAAVKIWSDCEVPKGTKLDFVTTRWMRNDGQPLIPEGE